MTEVCGIRDMGFVTTTVLYDIFHILLMSIITLFHNYGGNWLGHKGLIGHYNNRI